MTKTKSFDIGVKSVLAQGNSDLSHTNIQTLGQDIRHIDCAVRLPVPVVDYSAANLDAFKKAKHRALGEQNMPTADLLRLVV